jgi:hypothetical protein
LPGSDRDELIERIATDLEQAAFAAENGEIEDLPAWLRDYARGIAPEVADAG